MTTQTPASTSPHEPPAPPDWTTLPGAPAPGALVGLLDDFEQSRATLAELPSAAAGATPFRLLVLREGGTLRAFANRCAHFGVPLAAKQAQLIQMPMRSITCNVHYAKYRWADGSCESGECEGESLVPVPLVVDAQGQVLIAQHAVTL